MTSELLLVLGNKSLSSWSLTPRLALRHAGISFRERVVPLETSGGRDAIGALSPSGRVPALHHGELVLWGSLAICEYAAELFPDARLWPSGAGARAIARSVSAEVHSGLASLRRETETNGRACRETARFSWYRERARDGRLRDHGLVLGLARGHP